jgi:hypothetical protein
MNDGRRGVGACPDHVGSRAREGWACAGDADRGLLFYERARGYRQNLNQCLTGGIMVHTAVGTAGLPNRGLL